MSKWDRANLPQGFDETKSTSELADLADAHNSRAYGELSARELPESEFRAGLLKILGDEKGPEFPSFGPVRTFQVADLIYSAGGNIWGEHKDFPKSDWKYEVENGNTVLGYWEWVYVSAQEAPAPMKDLTITIAGGAGTGKRATALAIKQLLEANGATVVFADLNERLPADELLGLAPEVFPRLNVVLKTVQTQRLSTHAGPAEAHRGPIYIAWNAAKTQGFATTDYHLAYEARKGSNSNCFDQDGVRSDLAVTFCDVTGDEDCVIQTIHTSPKGD